MKYFELFSGIGGFSIALHKIKNLECVGFSEIDKNCNAVLAYRFPKIKNYGDITNLGGDKLPDFDIVVGGSPCQNLSVAGEREGLNGGKSRLFYEFVRILKEKKPKYFVWENVEGAIGSQRGFDFAEVQDQMADAGYNLSWQILNSSMFGLPLQRSRVFITGSNRKESGPKVLPITENDRLLVKKRSPTLPVLTATDYKGPSKQRAKIITKDSIGVRKFTPLEHERLLGLPDNWTKYGTVDGETIEISDTQRYKMCGNAVSPIVAEYIVKTLLSSWSKNEATKANNS